MSKNRSFPDILLDLINDKKINEKKSLIMVAGEIGISAGALSKYQNALAEPSISAFEKIADYFGVSYDYLLGKSISKKRENININERLGLSDEAIEVLKKYNNKNNYFKTQEMLDDIKLIPVVNYLLEQETPDPYSVMEMPGLRDGHLLFDVPGEVRQENEKELVSNHTKWKAKHYVPILSAISNYFKINIGNDEILEMTNKGKLREKIGEICFDGDIVQFLLKNEVIEKALLVDIQERLQKAKELKQNAEKEIKEGMKNGNG